MESRRRQMDHHTPNERFLELRARWPAFHYDGWTHSRTDAGTQITYRFEIPGLAVFTPTWVFPDGVAGRAAVRTLDSARGRRLVFALGMVELVSYWKATCSPTVRVHAGWLDAAEIAWWKDLYHRGLGEFFYRNGIPADPDAFMNLECAPTDLAAAQRDARDAAATSAEDAAAPGGQLVPVGGGKDSIVTLELLAARRSDNFPYVINPTTAAMDSARVAGYPAARVYVARRTLHPRLLELNRQGFLNGHTPFSAIVAFSAQLAAHLMGCHAIVLSNEASANTGNVPGLDVNHQYSKSLAFEQAFRAYARRHFGTASEYFSLLRPFNELQIARRFAAAPPAYREVFRSCNVGSRENRWCGQCPKCLFVRLILAPFLPADELDARIGPLLDDPARIPDLEALAGLTPLKPFECVGEAEEVRCAIEWTILNHILAGHTQPLLLRHYAQRMRELRGTDPAASPFPPADIDGMMRRFHTGHAIPAAFLAPVLRMREDVASDLG